MPSRPRESFFVALDPRPRGQLVIALEAGVASGWLSVGQAPRVAWLPVGQEGEIGPPTLMFAGVGLIPRPAAGPLVLVENLAHESDIYWTPVDTLAALRAGVVGIVNAGVLVMPEVVRELASVCGRGPERLLLGPAADRFEDFRRAVVEDWPSDGHDELDEICFRTAVALATMDRLRPIGVRGHKFAYSTLAHSMLARGSETSFTCGHDLLRRALSRLARLWNPAEELDESDLAHEPGGLGEEARLFLPDLARAHGFPRRIPLVPGNPPEAVASRLYRTLLGIEVLDMRDLGGIPSIRLRLAA
jgi:hypothetical protein